MLENNKITQQQGNILTEKTKQSILNWQMMLKYERFTIALHENLIVPGRNRF